jgi:type I restriction enzyme S subunit
MIEVEHEVESEVPEGWTQAALSDICDINPPKPSLDSLRPDELVTFVPMPAVDANTGSITSPQVRQLSEVRKGFTAFRENDVIMAKITPCMENGKAAIARNLVNGLGFGSTEFHVIRPEQGVLPEFIYHFIRQESYRKQAEAEMTGSVGQKRVPADFIQHTEIVLPPSGEQARMVAKIHALNQAVTASRNSLVRLPAIIKRFRQSVLAAACSGKLTEEWREHWNDVIATAETLRRLNLSATEGPTELTESWAWVRLSDLGELNRGRSRNRPRNAPHLYGGPYPFIQTGDIARSGGRISEHKQTYSEAGLAQSRLWPEGTVCITIAANIADSALLTYPACFPDSVVGLVTNPELCVPEYVEYFVRTARSDLSQFAPATAQKNINLEILNDVAVPTPPAAEQHEIVRRVEALFKLADAIEKRVATAQARADKLTQSILAKAFRGELVPTEAELARHEGREYEPASVLLERIRAERARDTGTPTSVVSPK